MARRAGETSGFGEDHPDVAALIGYVRGELSQLQAGNIRAHAVTCVDCGDQLAALILLRTESLRNENGEQAQLANVKRFPGPVRVPAQPPAPASRRMIVVAVAASLIILLGVFGWWTQAGGPVQTPIVGAPSAAAAALPQSIEYERTEEDARLVMGAVEFLAMIYNPAMQSAAGGEATDATRVARGLQAVVNRDLTEARRLLEPFEARWDRTGTAVVGSLMFLQGDPNAHQVLEMYAADHPQQTWQADADGAEGLAFFLLARLRQALGQDEGALDALGWIQPETETGNAAAKWRQTTFDDGD